MIIEALLGKKPEPKSASFRDRDGWFADFLLGGTDSVSGQSVNHDTALALPAYFCAINAISEDVAKLPVGTFAKGNPRGRIALDGHPATRLLNNSPNPEMTPITFRQTILSHALAMHGGFAEIVRRGDGTPAELWPLNPKDVTVARSRDTNELRYEVKPGNGMATVVLNSDQVFHIHGLGLDGVTAYVKTAIGRESFGQAIGAQRFSSAFFGNGTTASGVLEHPKVLSDDALKHLKDSFYKRHVGADNSHKPMILEEGMKWSQISTTPEDSQLLETMQFTVEDVSRWLRIQPHKIMHLLRSTFSNIEQQSIEYVVDTLMSWIIRIEQEAWRKLLTPDEQDGGVSVKHEVQALMRGDQSSRSAFYREMFGIGALSQNDIRELEDMNPIDNGDVYYVPANMMPTDQASQVDRGDDNASLPGTFPAEDNDTEEGEGQEEALRLQTLESITVSHKKLLGQSLGRLLRVERDKVLRVIKNKDSLEDFYSGHGDYVVSKVGEVIDSYIECIWPVLFSGMQADSNAYSIGHVFTRGLAKRHCKESYTDALAAGVRGDNRVLDGWSDGRAHIESDMEIDNLAAFLPGGGIFESEDYEP